MCDVVDIEASNVDGSVEGAVHGIGSMALQEIVEHIDIADPAKGVSMDGFREELDGSIYLCQPLAFGNVTCCRHWRS